MEIKPGVKTSEFWITLAIMVLGAVMSVLAFLADSGTIGGPLVKALLIILPHVLAYLKARQYTAGRVEEKLTAREPTPVKSVAEIVNGG